MIDFRDFKIEEKDDNTVVISQTDSTDPDYVNSIYLDKKQIGFFIGALSGRDIKNIGYIVDVNFKELVEPLRILVDRPEELGKLHKDINMNGFGIECEIENSERIVYKWED